MGGRKCLNAEIGAVYEPVEAEWGVEVGEVSPIPVEYIIIGVGAVGLLIFFLLSKKKR